MELQKMKNKNNFKKEVGEQIVEKFAKIRDSHFALKHWFG